MTELLARTSSLAPELDQLEALSEEELFGLIGTVSLSAVEHRSAAMYAYGGEIATRLERHALIERIEVDLVGRGRRTVERVLSDWADELRPRVCELWKKKAGERDLALVIAAVLLALLPTPAMIIAGIALAIAKYLMDKLCGGDRSAAGEPLPAIA